MYVVRISEFILIKHTFHRVRSRHILYVYPDGHGKRLIQIKIACKMASQNNLFDALKENLQRSGKLSKLKAQLRSDIIKILEPMSNTSPEPEIPSECAIINELIREYLSWHGYKYTECVFSAEIKLPSEPLDRVSLIRSIGVVETERTSKLPLLYSIVSTFKEMVQRP